MAIPAPRPGSAALVTGASSGIGLELARQLHTRGHRVILVARREDRLTQLAAELREHRADSADVIACDLTDRSARSDLLARLQALGLEVDILVNSAGFGMGGPFLEQDPDRIVSMARTNLEAVFALTRALAPGMVERGRGAVLVVSSMAGYQPWPNFGAYAATKAGATSFALMLGEELRGTGVTVTALTPGGVETEFAEVAEMERQRDTSVLARSAMIGAEECARAGLAGLDAGARTVTPTLAIRAFVAAGRFMPRAVWLPICRRMLR